MRNLFFMMAFLLSTFARSQDFLTLKSGEEIKVKIIELTPTEVKYKRFNNLDGPLVTISKADVFMIKYENGDKEIMTEKNVSKESGTDDMFQQGIKDANINYTTVAPGTGTFIVTLLGGGILGLIPAVACSSTQPTEENLNYKNPSLMKNSSYRNAYTQQAHKIKKVKVWTNWTIAFLIDVTFVLILTSHPH